MENQGDSGTIEIGSHMPAIGQDGESYEFATRDGGSITVPANEVYEHKSYYTGATPGQTVEVASRAGCGKKGVVEKWIGDEVVQEITPEEENGNFDVLVPVNSGEVCEGRQFMYVSVDNTNGPESMDFSYYDVSGAPLSVLIMGTFGMVAAGVLVYWLGGVFDRFTDKVRADRYRSARARTEPQTSSIIEEDAPTLVIEAGEPKEAADSSEEEDADVVTYQDMLDDLNEVRVAYANAVTFSGPQREYVFTAPAVLDSSVPATAAFIEAMSAADLKFYESMDLEAEADRSTVRAVERAVEAWDEAVNFARLNVRSSIDPKYHSRVRALLEIVLRSEDGNAEAMNARDRLVGILSDITYDVPTVGSGVTTTRALSGENMVNLGKIKDARSLAGGSTRLQIENRGATRTV